MSQTHSAIPARIACVPIHLYQLARAGRPSPCRFQPTCSAYALEALETHGVFQGTWLACKRLIRCRPGSTHGWDPVPDRKSF